MTLGKNQYGKLENDEAVPSKLRRNGFQSRILCNALLLINYESRIKMLLDM